jgi:hypothetical protein
MKTSFRKAAAAMVLLAPMGVMLAVPPAAAQDAPPAARRMFGNNTARVIVIERFDMSGVLATGQEVRFRMIGVPGGTGRVTVPGVLQNADMAETSPGVYELSHRLSVRDNPAAFPHATATLHAAGTVVTARLGSGASAPGYDSARGPSYDGRGGYVQGRPQRDDRGPVIGQVTPSHGQRIDERGRTHIAARFGDDGSGVDPNSVRLLVDGRDVTGASRVQGDEIRYRENLAPGRHVAEVMVRDRAGNLSRRSWSFDVSDDGRNYGYGQPYRW